MEVIALSFEGLRRRAAAAGVTLLQVKDEKGEPCYLVSRWHMQRDLPTLEAVAQWLDRVTGANHRA